MSRKDSPAATSSARQNDALLEFETSKRRFLLANKHITRLNSTLSDRIEELNSQISSLFVENLRLRASEIALTAELQRERAKGSRTASIERVPHFRPSFGTGQGSSPKPARRTHSRPLRRNTHSNTHRDDPLLEQHPSSSNIQNAYLGPNGLSRPPDVPTILEEESDSPSPERQVLAREDNRNVERAERDCGEYASSSSLGDMEVSFSGTREIQVHDLTNDIRINDPHPVDCGGFADIYRGEWIQNALDPEDGVEEKRMQVAVKLLRVFSRRDAHSGRTRKRLNREVYVWKRLNHPNVAKFYGVSFKLGGRPSLVMQWYENGPAPSYLLSRSDECRLEIVKDVSRGLRYLHTLSVVHGDLKGNNILVDDDGHAILTDFGLSKVIEELAGPTGNTTSMLGGTIRWQAPELIFDKHEEDGEEGHSRKSGSCLSLSSDVWSFACTAYELLTGRIPYEHYLRDWDVMQDIIQAVPPLRPDDTIIYRSQDLLALLKKCWTPRPSCRPDMDSVERELENILFGS